MITPPSAFLLDERVFVSLGVLKVAASLEAQRWRVNLLDLSGVENFLGHLEDYLITCQDVAIGITADSFIVYFERLRDEVREGKTLRPAVESGWKRARRTILVSDTVSFLAAVLLYHFAVSDVQGFAYTLGLTTLIDVVVVFLFTKPMVTFLAGTSSGSPSPDRDASAGWVVARSVNTVLRRRHSIHSAGVALCFDVTSVAPMKSQIITRRSASA